MNDEELQSTSSVDELMRQQDFGTCFRIAREAEGLSLSDVSDELKLPEETIHALELSKIEQLPAAAFTQGYIRSYARFLKLPEDEILEIYNQLLPDEEVPLTARSSLPRQAHSGETKIKLTTYGFVLTGLLVMVVWWLQTVPESTDIKTIVIEDEVFETKNGTDDAVDARMDMDETLESVDPAVDQPVVEKRDVSAVVDMEPAISKVPENKQALVDVVETKADNIIPKPLKKRTGDVSEFIAASGDDVLILGTISESWVEIQDATTPRLVFELIEKGGYYRVKGQAPFKIFLGNAPSVSIQINGKAVNVLNYLRSGKLVHVYLYKDGEVVSVSRHEKLQNNIKIQSSVSGDDQASDTTLPELE